MTAVALPASASRRSRSSGRRTAVACAFVAAAAGGVLVGHRYASDPSAVEASLALLLRFMAVCKAATALAAAGLLAWRLGRPLAGAASAAYAGALCLMGAAPGMIWSLGLVGPGALVFHAGMILFLATSLRDDVVASAVSARRRRG